MMHEMFYACEPGMPVYVMKWCKVYDAEWSKCERCMQVCSMKWCNECIRRLKHSSRGHYWGDRSQSAGRRHWYWWPCLGWGDTWFLSDDGTTQQSLAGDGRDDLSIWWCRPLLGNNWRCRGIELATDSLGSRVRPYPRSWSLLVTAITILGMYFW